MVREAEVSPSAVLATAKAEQRRTARFLRFIVVV
jgi:hypothetical protein